MYMMSVCMCVYSLEKKKWKWKCMVLCDLARIYVLVESEGPHPVQVALTL